MKLRPIILLVFICVGPAACSSLFNVEPSPRESIEIPLYERYRVMALEYANRHELQRALFFWKIVNSLNPGDAETAAQIENLEQVIRKSAQAHYRKGLNHYRHNRLQKARQELLLALKIDPGHQKALELIKYRMNAEQTIRYTIKKGDTLHRIAETVYGDAGAVLLLEKLCPPQVVPRKLAPGHLLVLPKLEKPLTRMLAQSRIEQKIQAARDLIDSRQASKAIPLLEAIRKEYPANQAAVDMLNGIYYEKGMWLMYKHKDLASLAMFNKADTGYRNVDKLKQQVRKRLRDLAEKHYRQGVKWFVQEELRKAMVEWEAALKYNPDHAKARRDHTNARKLLERLEDLKKQKRTPEVKPD